MQNKKQYTKTWALILSFFFLLGSYYSKAQNEIQCKLEIDASIDDLISPAIQPGDTICLMAGMRGALYFKNITGTSEQPVVIINKGGQSIIDSDLAYGLKFVNCQYIKLSGAGDENYEYGIAIQNVSSGYGIGLESKSSDFEIEHLEISNTSVSGIVAKTDPDCTYTAVRDSFTMYNINIHDNYIHHTGNEGMYIGSSMFLGHYISECDTVLYPHIIDGVEIYNNRVEYTGWDAIQVGSALNNCNVHDNEIFKDSQAEISYQMSGIMINVGSTCDVYNNKIIDGKGTGIINQGTGGQKFFNNLIVNAGRDYDFEDQSKQQFGIFSKYAYIQKPDSTFHFYNNTIINPKSDGIRIMNSHSEINRIVNNIIINPGAYEFYANLGSTSYEANDAYLHNYLNSSPIYASNNIFQRSAKNQFFADTLTLDYHLTKESPAANWGFDLTSYGIVFDLDNNPRPFENYMDIGAFELQVLTPIVSIDKGDQNLKIYPNPAIDYIHLNFFLDKAQKLNISLIGLDGKETRLMQDVLFEQGKNEKTIALKAIHSGVYLLVLENDSKRMIQKVQKF